MNVRTVVLLSVSSIWAACTANAASDSLLLLHTNDIHDHVRPGYDGVGGIAYVSGYVRAVRAERNDVLLLDAGDVMEKGDMVAFVTKSRVVHEAMGRIGYDAGTPGNHDTDFGAEYLHECDGFNQDMAMLCLNYVKPDGSTHFPGSKLFDVDGVKVGVIGLTVPKTGEFLDENASAAALAAEAARLDEEAHLIIAVCHFGGNDCVRMSRQVPAVDVWVSGHTHERIEEPRIVPETQAVIVQAGCYAQAVGRLELSIDLDAEKVRVKGGELVPMRHDTIPCDAEMLAWIREQEKQHCPEAIRVVGHTEKVVGSAQVAWLAAEALRVQGKSEVAFCHGGQVIRAGLPAGEIDVNAIFCTGGQRGYRIVRTRLTGADINRYLEDLVEFGRGKASFAGFQGDVRYEKDSGSWTAQTSLDPERSYDVVMPELEWESRFLKVLEKRRARQDAAGEPEAIPEAGLCDFSFTDAVVAYVEAHKDRTVDALAEGLESAAGMR